MQPYASTAAPAQAAIHNASVLAPFARAWQSVASRPALACSSIFVLTLALRIALLPWMHVPKPAVHDEFSYLLAADTYAHGRLTNPPLPFWEHFETFHVIQRPTYMSKFPPLPGLVLAFGERFFGDPWIGVLITTALMGAAMCWMLQGWLPPGAALLGALLIVLRFGVFDYWMNSYYGGAIPAIGGALVFGAIARIVFKKQFAYGAMLGAGLAILLASRPFDLAVVGVASIAVIAWALWHGALPSRAAVRIALASGAILAVAGAALAYNNYRVTGNALLLPYQLHDRQYAVTSVFLWSTPGPEPVYHHPVLREFWAHWFVKAQQAARADPLGSLCTKLTQIYDFFFGFWPFLILLLVWPYRRKKIEERLNVALVASCVIALAAPLAGIMPHYVASVSCLMYLLLMQTLLRLRDWRPFGQPAGLALAAITIALFVFGFATKAVELRSGENLPRHAIARDSVIRTLNQEPGQKLVLVRYSPQHYIHEDWINNLADLDSQPIVWAREMGPTEDRPLIEHFHNRRVWLLEPDQNPPKLSRYQELLKRPAKTSE